MIRIGDIDYYTVSDVAEAAGLSRQTIDRYIQDREIDQPVRRQHGKRKVRTYNDREYQRVIEQIKNFQVTS